MGHYKYKSVLLVDDSYIDNLINRKILEANKFADSIIVMDSPFKAIEYLNSCSDKESLPEIIFLDIRMPEMSGFEFLQELNNVCNMDGSDLRIYMLSSSLDPGDLKKVEGNSLVAKFIGKPLTNKVLEEIK